MSACPFCSAAMTAGETQCRSCGRAVTAPRQSVGATVQMDTRDLPTLITPGSGSTGDTEPRARDKGLNSKLAESLVAATAGEYEIKRELGRGGMAIVFQAYDLSLDRQVAIKVMSPALLDGEGAVERFKREARTAAGLSHPHIIPIHAVRETGDTLFFVMKYVEGRPLDDVIRERGPLPIPLVVQILTEVASALAYAHKRGVIHRDIKPANIMLDDGGWATVADFGIAKVAEKKGITQTGMAVGTPAYMSPEQCMSKGVDGRSDQYSLGIVGYELLSGRTPYDGDSLMEVFLAHMNNPLPSIRAIRPDCPPALAAIIERMLAKSSSDRFASLDEVVDALAPIQRGASKDRTRTSLMELARVEATAAEATVVVPSLPGAAAASAPTASSPTTRTVVPRWAIAAGVVAIVAVGGWLAVKDKGASGASTPPSPDPVTLAGAAVTKVALSPDKSTITIGTSAPLTIAARDSFDRPVSGKRVEWSTGNAAVATVDTAGTVTAVGVGSTTVQATVDGRSASAIIEVTDKPLVPKTVALNPKDSTVDVGARFTLVAAVTGDRGASLIGTTVDWRSAAPDIASVDSKTGHVSALKPGTTTIAVSVPNGPRASMKLTVVAPRAAVARLDVTPGTLALTVGDTARAQAAVFDARNGMLRDRDVAWTTDQPDILSVDRSTGRITALKDGEARLVATADTVSRAISVSIKRAAAPVPAVTPTATDSAATGSPAGTADAPKFTEISAGGSTTCGALSNDAGVICWGEASLTGAKVEGLLLAKIAVGDGHTCGLTPAGEAWCWGSNAQGQLGDGSTTNRPTPVAVKGQTFADISVGASHTCALTNDNTAFCWGSNKNGQLGDGSRTNRNKPTLVKSTEGNRGFKSIAAGGSHSCGVSLADKAFCWGDGFSGQVGNAMTDFAMEPFAVKTDLSFRSIVVGQQHTCGLTTSGRAYCWGDNRNGQLGNETKDNRNVPDSVATDQIFRTLAAGAQHACGITSRRQLYCWGQNADGRLGDGSRSIKTVPALAAGGTTFSALSAGSGHTCALTTTSVAMCWGSNTRGQLGSGSSSPYSASPVVVKVKGGG